MTTLLNLAKKIWHSRPDYSKQDAVSLASQKLSLRVNIADVVTQWDQQEANELAAEKSARQDARQKSIALFTSVIPWKWRIDGEDPDTENLIREISNLNLLFSRLKEQGNVFTDAELVLVCEHGRIRSHRLETPEGLWVWQDKGLYWPATSTPEQRQEQEKPKPSARRDYRPDTGDNLLNARQWAEDGYAAGDSISDD